MANQFLISRYRHARRACVSDALGPFRVAAPPAQGCCPYLRSGGSHRRVGGPPDGSDRCRELILLTARETRTAPGQPRSKR
jgi:hypothetical protein